MKKLVSVWIDVEKIERIKRIKNKPMSEFIRESVDSALSPDLAYDITAASSELNIGLYCLKNDISLSYNDYAYIFSQLDSFYTGSETGFIKDEETIFFAVVAIKMITTEFNKCNINEHPYKYFTDYLWANHNTNREEIEYAQQNAGGFIHYLEYLIHGLKTSRFQILGLIRIVTVFMRDYGTKKNHDKILELCNCLNNTIIELIEYVLVKSPDNYGKPYSRMLKQK